MPQGVKYQPLHSVVYFFLLHLRKKGVLRIVLWRLEDDKGYSVLLRGPSMKADHPVPLLDSSNPDVAAFFAAADENQPLAHQNGLLNFLFFGRPNRSKFQ